MKFDMGYCETWLENVELVILHRPKSAATAQWEQFGKELAAKSSCLVFLWSSISEDPYPSFLSLLRSSLDLRAEKTAIVVNIVSRRVSVGDKARA